MALSRRYGELDGALSYLYASHFVDNPCRGACVYSDPIPDRLESSLTCAAVVNRRNPRVAGPKPPAVFTPG